MVKLDAIRQSPANILSNSKNARKAYDKAWNAAARAPIFCKIVKKTTPDGKSRKFHRTARLIGAHAYQIAASGAAANAARQMEIECNALREDVESESMRAPWLPQVSKGAKLVLEQFLCAMAQEATMKAHAVRQGCGSTKRISRKHMQLGWDAVFENVFSNTAMMPKTMYVAPVEKKVSKKKGASKEAEANDDEDYAPVEDEEEPVAEE